MKIILYIFLISSFTCTGAAKAACKIDAYNQFDFWLGEWQVHTKNGKLAGTNKISKTYAGCVLKEQYTATTPYRGESINTYDKSTGQWHQTWVDNGGLLLKLDGNWNGISMVMSGMITSKSGETMHRITWTPQIDKSVHQVWDTSQDQGKTWKNVFHGIYTKQPRH
jgi:hypothetical protein